MADLIYRLENGFMWNVKNARQFIPVQTANLNDEYGPADLEIIDLRTATGRSDLEYLAETLAFYGYPLGELAIYSAKGIKEELDRLDKQYLTPRILAGLSTGDEYAQGQWQEHEEKAAPLRNRLKQMEEQQ